MGKGSNVSKIMRARAEAAKKAEAEGKGGGGAKGMAERRGLGAASIQCAICKVSFLSTQSKSQLTMHQESKHSKSTFKECFPDFKEDE